MQVLLKLIFKMFYFLVSLLNKVFLLSFEVFITCFRYYWIVMKGKTMLALLAFGAELIYFLVLGNFGSLATLMQYKRVTNFSLPSSIDTPSSFYCRQLFCRQLQRYRQPTLLAATGRYGHPISISLSVLNDG